MKVKEVDRTANVAWGPREQYPIYLAAGTAAQQLDASFSTAAALEIFHVDFANHDLDMPVAGLLPCEHRFNKLAWGSFGMSTGEHASGLIVGGTDNGVVCVYSPAMILAGNTEMALVEQLEDHNGPVTAIDINKHQQHLLATGSSDSEIFIWDLKNPEAPLTPGAKSTPPDQVSCLAWNQQVQHILASSSQTGRVVVWDLRKSEPIIKVGDQSSMFHYKSLAWHPDVATQMLVGNEDDRYPCIQMWDLRFATSPMKIFEGHSRGILSLAWCSQDSDLLMSCGKDNRILCWNPHTQAPKGEIVYELFTTSQWTSDVSWCPRNPGVLATTSFDGHVTISSLMGGTQTVTPSAKRSTSISDAFGIASEPSFPSQAQEPTTHVFEPLKTPPKWMRKPCAARFAFGGKLVTFGNSREAGLPRQVHISQVVTEGEFLSRSQQLENCLLTGQLFEYCDMKIQTVSDAQEQKLWQFLRGNFDTEPRLQYLNLLGYNPQELADKFACLSAAKDTPRAHAPHSGVDAHELASKMRLLQTDVHKQEPKGFSLSGAGSPNAGAKTPGSEGELPSAFSLLAGGDPHSASAFDMIGGAVRDDAAEDLTSPEPRKLSEPLVISTADDADGLICQALLTGNFEAAVDVCFRDGRTADGLLLAIAGGPDLYARTQRRYLDRATTTVAKLISAVVSRDWRSIVNNCLIENWKEALAILVTYGKSDEFSGLCCLLGERLEAEASDYSSAMVCFICAGDVDRLVSCWMKFSAAPETAPLALQDLIEKVMVLRKSIEVGSSQKQVSVGDVVAGHICKYANILASQGNLQTAMVYLSTVSNKAVSFLKDRVYQAAGHSVHAGDAPFKKVEIRAHAGVRSPGPHKLGSSAPYSAHRQATPPSHANAGLHSAHPQQPSPVRASLPPATQLPPPSQPHAPSPATFVPAPVSPPSAYNPPVVPGSSYHQQPASQPISGMFQPPRSHAGVPPPGVAGLHLSGNVMPPMPSSAVHPGAVLPPPASGTTFAPPPNMMGPSARPQATSRPGVGGPSHAGYASQPPPVMTPPLPEPSHVPPPSSGGVHPMSMRAVRQDSPVATTLPPAPVAFYNPAAVPQPQQASGMLPMVSTMPPPSVLPPGQVNHPNPVVKKEPEPPAEVIKGPIPAEHMILRDTFEALVDRCRNSSKNPQHKRKLEEVSKKLEVLYDLLRDCKISPNVLHGLHQMSQTCQSGDYMLGIQIHTRMISTGNFSEISSFMPGLKTLMQIAEQLRC